MIQNYYSQNIKLSATFDRKRINRKYVKNTVHLRLNPDSESFVKPHIYNFERKKKYEQEMLNYGLKLHALNLRVLLKKLKIQLN